MHLRTEERSHKHRTQIVTAISSWPQTNLKKKFMINLLTQPVLQSCKTSDDGPGQPNDEHSRVRVLKHRVLKYVHDHDPHSDQWATVVVAMVVVEVVVGWVVVVVVVVVVSWVVVVGFGVVVVSSCWVVGVDVVCVVVVVFSVPEVVNWRSLSLKNIYMR